MKKIVITLFTVVSLFVFMFGTVGMASASEINVQEMKDSLAAEGLSMGYLQSLTDSHIAMLYRDSYEYDFSYEEKTVFMDENTDDNISSSEVTPLGHIDESMFKLKISRVTYLDVNNRVSKVNIVINYEWLKDPMIKKTDGISVNWDNSLFTFQADSFYSYDILVLAGESKKRNENTVPDLAQQGGIGYSAVLGFNISAGAIIGRAKGTASFYLLPTNLIYQSSSSSGGSVSSINVNYVHDRTPLFGSISFTYAGFGVSISAPALNDSSSASLNFYYKR